MSTSTPLQFQEAMEVVVVIPTNNNQHEQQQQFAAAAAAAVTNEYNVDLLNRDVDSDSEQQRSERGMLAPGSASSSVIITPSTASVPTLLGGRHNEYRREYHGYSCFALLMLALLIATAVMFFMAYHDYENSSPGNSCNAVSLNPYSISLAIFIVGCIIVGAAVLSHLVLSFHTANMLVSLSFLALLILAIIGSVWLANAPGGPSCNQNFVDQFTKSLIMLWVVVGVSMCVGWYGNTVFKQPI